MAAILLIDDEEHVLGMMEDVLRHRGWDPVAVSDSEEALRLLDARPFDVIVSDVMMPRLNGLRLLETVRGQGRRIQVILVTGYATREVAEDALANGAYRLLQKPFSVDDLVTAVEGALEAGSA